MIFIVWPVSNPVGKLRVCTVSFDGYAILSFSIFSFIKLFMCFQEGGREQVPHNEEESVQPDADRVQEVPNMQTEGASAR